MAERQAAKPEIAAQKTVVKLPPAIGDWTTYKPPKVLVKKVKTGLYGFDRLSQEELDQFLHIHYRFVQQILKRFKIDLGMAVELFSVSVVQTTYLNFLRTLLGPMVQCKLTIPDMHDPVFFALELSLASSIINHALGSMDLEPINRALTESEKTALLTALSEYLPLFSSAFENVVEAPSLSIVSSPDIIMDPTINPSSTYVGFSAEAALAENPPGKIMFAYPGSALKALLAKYRQKDAVKPLDFSRFPGALLAKIMAPLAATLGETQLTTDEIHELEAGDVVSLDTSIASPIPVEIGNILKLLGQPGTRNRKAAIRIIGFKETPEVELAPPELAPPPTPTPPPKPEEKKVPEKEPPAKKIEEEFPEEEEEEFTEEDLLEEEFPEEGFEEEEELPEEEAFK